VEIRRYFHGPLEHSFFVARAFPIELDSHNPEPMANADGALFPFWSPGGSRIGFFADGQLKIVAGTIHSLAPAGQPRGGAWNADDAIVFVPCSP
jgi:hypothetical protein